MKKSVCVFVLAFAFSIFAFAQNESLQKILPWHFSIAPSVTTRIGEQREYVYQKNKDGKMDTLSELDWQQKPIVFFGADATAGYKNFYFTGGAKVALPSDTGKMYDYDWLNIDDVSENDPRYGIKTNYSEHTNHLDLYYILSTELLYSFEFAGFKNCISDALQIDSVSVSPFAQFEYSYSRFTGKEGSASYGNNTGAGDIKYAYNDSENSEKYNFSGDVIQLERITYFTWAGFLFKAVNKRGIFASFNFALSPFVHVDSLDSHLKKNTFYLDSLTDFMNGIKTELTFGKKFGRHHSIFIKALYQNIFEFDGTTSNSNQKHGTYIQSPNADSGASFSWFEISLGYAFAL